MANPINYNPYNTPHPYNPPFEPPAPYPMPQPTQPWTGPQHPPKGPYGKFCNDGFLINYDGLTSDTAEVIVDNANRYIKVNVIPSVLHAPWIYEQAEPASSWQIQHNLGTYPNITILNSAGEVVMADIKYLDSHNIQVIFSEAVAGKALLG